MNTRQQATYIFCKSFFLLFVILDQPQVKSEDSLMDANNEPEVENISNLSLGDQEHRYKTDGERLLLLKAVSLSGRVLILSVVWRKEMLYLTTHSTHFILWLNIW